ncbi:MAG TPA: hypothetical protein VGP01_07040, partial [Rhizomicrobium sp.]|nr:hypothetical protein [Rhizomicrobium sp.]
GNDFAAKLAGGQESHGALPGYNLVLSTIAFWPAILFVASGIGLGIAKAKEPMVRFLLAWAGSWWLVCELVPTKLPHYVLPAYPALAILTAFWVLMPKGEDQGLSPGWRKTLSTVAMLQYLVGLAALSAAPVWLPELYGGGFVTGLIASAVVGGLIGLGALIMLLTGARLVALSLALLSFLILTPSLTMGAGPRLTDLWLTPTLKALVAKDARPGDPAPALAGYEEPSLVFALGADVNLTDGRGAARLGADFGGLALVDDYEQPKFLARLAELQSDAVPVDEARGFDYSRGKKVHVTVYRVRKLITAPPSEHGVTH